MAPGNSKIVLRTLALMALCVCAQAVLAQPSLAVRDGSSVAIPDGGTFAQGNRSDVQYSVAMQLRNNGSSDLNVSGVVFSNAMNCSIAAGGTYPRIVAPSTHYPFSSTMVLNAPGPFSATCTVTSNDPVAPSYVITVSGTATTNPNIRVNWAGGGVASGGTQNIGSTYAPGTGYNLTLTVMNYSIAAALGLDFAAGNSLDLLTTSNCTVMLPADPTGSIASGASVNIVLNVTPTAAGPFSFVPRIYTNDPDTAVWSATFDGTATTTPVMRISVNGGYRPPGSTAAVNGATAGVAHTVNGAVQNNGSQNLVLSGAPLIAFSGQVNCNCTLPVAPSSTILPGASSNFEISVMVTAAGNFSFDITVTSNDPVNPGYVVNFSGTTLAAPPNINMLLGGTVLANNASFVATGAVKGVQFNIQGGIQNSGGTSLNLSGTPLIAISAQSNCSATISVAPLAAIPAAQTSTFALAVTPVNDGSYSFDITVTSDDPDTPSYVVHVQGTAANPSSGGDDDSGCTAGNSDALAFSLVFSSALAALLWRRRRARA